MQFVPLWAGRPPACPPSISPPTICHREAPVKKIHAKKLQSLQISHLLQQESPVLVNRILAQVRENHPGHLQSDEALRRSIIAGLKRARVHGLHTDDLLTEYVLVMFEIAPNFDQHPVIAQVLDDARLPVEERWDRIFAEDLDPAWQETAQPGFCDQGFWRDPEAWAADAGGMRQGNRHHAAMPGC
jgi:hypothetical protein